LPHRFLMATGHSIDVIFTFHDQWLSQPQYHVPIAMEKRYFNRYFTIVDTLHHLTRSIHSLNVISNKDTEDFF